MENTERGDEPRKAHVGSHRNEAAGKINTISLLKRKKRRVLSSKEVHPHSLLSSHILLFPSTYQDASRNLTTFSLTS